MTPAVLLLQRRNISHQIHSYHHDPGVAGYGQEAADKLELPPGQVFKTLLVCDASKALTVALVPVSANLDMKKLSQIRGARKLTMAESKAAERVTGFQVGGISPIGQKRLLPTVIDSSAQAFSAIFVSGGKRGLEIEIAPEALASLLGARFGDIARY